ncbi:MAG: extracellular solute-binding protein, partial [Oscillospiraceae bacterium]|nr:extracellular solute-binding protein [Oscillospiraceae bacterium]
TWTESLDQMITEQMNSFNRRNPNYRIEVITFGSASELQMLMQSDTPPDLICWDGDWVDDPPSAQLYGAKGYLTDLGPLVEADPELSMSDFIPSCVELIQETYGSFYLFPREFYARTLVAPSEYVGEEMGWTLEEFCDTAKNLPEGMTIWGGDGKTLLNMLLETGMGAFVDYTAGTCDFENQTFIDLLTVCRDRCSAEENWEEGLGNNLMKVESVMGRFGNFAIETMIPAKEQGLTLIGYPGAGGNGMNLTFSGCVSITTVGSHPDVAWDFVRELMSYDFQKNSYGFASIREDVFNEKEDSYAEMYAEDAAEADFAAAKALPYDAGCSTVYDSPVAQIVMEEAEAFFAGDKSAEETARVIQNRVSIYLGEQF